MVVLLSGGNDQLPFARPEGPRLISPDTVKIRLLRYQVEITDVSPLLG